jgi:hypothetical protein
MQVKDTVEYAGTNYIVSYITRAGVKLDEVKGKETQTIPLDEFEILLEDGTIKILTREK